MGKNVLERRKIFGFSTTINLNPKRGDMFITDGTVDVSSRCTIRDERTGRESVRIEQCTYVVYSNGDNIIIEARDGAEEKNIVEALPIVEKSMRCFA